MRISPDQFNELTGLIEDTVQYFCDKELASGQVAWTVVETLGTAKLAELNGELLCA